MLALVLAATISFSLIGCANSQNGNKTLTPANAELTETADKAQEAANEAIDKAKNDKINQTMKDARNVASNHRSQNR